MAATSARHRNPPAIHTNDDADEADDADDDAEDDDDEDDADQEDAREEDDEQQEEDDDEDAAEEAEKAAESIDAVLAQFAYHAAAKRLLAIEMTQLQQQQQQQQQQGFPTLQQQLLQSQHPSGHLPHDNLRRRAEPPQRHQQRISIANSAPIVAMPSAAIATPAATPAAVPAAAATSGPAVLLLLGVGLLTLLAVGVVLLVWLAVRGRRATGRWSRVKCSSSGGGAGGVDMAAATAAATAAAEASGQRMKGRDHNNQHHGDTADNAERDGGGAAQAAISRVATVSGRTNPAVSSTGAAPPIATMTTPAVLLSRELPATVIAGSGGHRRTSPPPAACVVIGQQQPISQRQQPLWTPPPLVAQAAPPPSHQPPTPPQSPPLPMTPMTPLSVMLPHHQQQQQQNHASDGSNNSSTSASSQTSSSGSATVATAAAAGTMMAGCHGSSSAAAQRFTFATGTHSVDSSSSCSSSSNSNGSSNSSNSNGNSNSSSGSIGTGRVSQNAQLRHDNVHNSPLATPLFASLPLSLPPPPPQSPPSLSPPPPNSCAPIAATPHQPTSSPPPPSSVAWIRHDVAAIAASVYSHGGDLCCVVQPHQQQLPGDTITVTTSAQASPLRQQQQPLSPAVLFAYPQQAAASVGGGTAFSFSPTMLSGSSGGGVGVGGGGGPETAHSPKLGRLLSGVQQQVNKENATPGSPSSTVLVVASSPRLLQQHLQHCHQQQHFSPRMLDGGGGGGGGGGASAPPTCSPFMSSAGYKHGNYFRFPDVQMTADGGNGGGSTANADATNPVHTPFEDSPPLPPTPYPPKHQPQSPFAFSHPSAAAPKTPTIAPVESVAINAASIPPESNAQPTVSAAAQLRRARLASISLDSDVVVVPLMQPPPACASQNLRNAAGRFHPKNVNQLSLNLQRRGDEATVVSATDATAIETASAAAAETDSLIGVSAARRTPTLAQHRQKAASLDSAAAARIADGGDDDEDDHEADGADDGSTADTADDHSLLPRMGSGRLAHNRLHHQQQQQQRMRHNQLRERRAIHTSSSAAAITCSSTMTAASVPTTPRKRPMSLLSGAAAVQPPTAASAVYHLRNGGGDSNSISSMMRLAPTAETPALGAEAPTMLRSFDFPDPPTGAAHVRTTTTSTGGTILQRRGSNQNLTLTVLDAQPQPTLPPMPSRHGLALSASNHSLTTMRGSHCSLQQIAGTPTTAAATGSETATASLTAASVVTAAQRKPNLLQRRGSNTSLTLSIRGCGGGGGGGGGSMTSLNRYNSHSSLNYAMAGGRGGVQGQATLMSKSTSSTATAMATTMLGSAVGASGAPVTMTHGMAAAGGGLGARRGLLDRRNSNASLTLNIGGGGGGLAGGMGGGGGGGLGGGGTGNGGACGAACANGRGLSVSNCNLRSSELSLAGSGGALETLSHHSVCRPLSKLTHHPSHHFPRHTLDAISAAQLQATTPLAAAASLLPLANPQQQQQYQQSQHPQHAHQQQRRFLSSENLQHQHHPHCCVHTRATTAARHQMEPLELKSTHHLQHNQQHHDVDDVASSFSGASDMDDDDEDDHNVNLDVEDDDDATADDASAAAAPHCDCARLRRTHITTKPLSPQTTSEDFKIYLANIQMLQNASRGLSAAHLRALGAIFRRSYRRRQRDNGGEGAATTTTATTTTMTTSLDDRFALPVASTTTTTTTQTATNDGDDDDFGESQKRLLRELHQEFWDLPTNYQEKPLVFGSQAKNRYKTILPNEHSRVRLEMRSGGGATTTSATTASFGTTDLGDEPELYINANYIKGPDYTHNAYIATQGPLPNTLHDFWLMVHQNIASTAHQSNTTNTTSTTRPPHPPSTKTGPPGRHRRCDSRPQQIAMLTDLIEHGRAKCAPYFASAAGRCLLVGRTDDNARLSLELPTDDENGDGGGSGVPPTFSGYRIETRACRDAGGGGAYTVRRLHVSVWHRGQRPPGGDTFAVCHYWFPDWPDHRSPDDVDVLLDLCLDMLDADGGDCEDDEVGGAEEEDEGEEVNEPGTDDDGQKEEEQKPTDPPSPLPIVHCSAGIGRTGCMIAILNGLRQMRSAAAAAKLATSTGTTTATATTVDVLGIVCNLRLQRGGMVQNSEQYELIHRALCLYAQRRSRDGEATEDKDDDGGNGDGTKDVKHVEGHKNEPEEQQGNGADADTEK